jgi:hypothetical protein
MGNVLPLEKDDEKFVRTVVAAPEVVKIINQIDIYSSVAGKYNGPSIGMSKEEAKAAPARLTGPALGSKATALMAFFTTGWREQLQKLTMERPYPAEPFELLSAEEVLRSVKATHDDRTIGAQKSQTERGMDLLWTQIAPFYANADQGDAYGDVTEDYRKAYALGWLALNAETNIRQNEKLPGVTATAAPRPIMPFIFGNPSAYAEIAKELVLARRAYKAIGSDKGSRCLERAELFTAAAAKLKDGEVGKVDKKALAFIDGVKIVPVLADIGMEVKDKEDGIFRLHLGLGYGHTLEATIGDETYQLWTPSAMVLHLDEIQTTADWQDGLVDEYDPQE